MPPPSRSLAGLGGDFAFTNLRLALARFRFVGVETGGFHRISASCRSCGTTFFVALLFAPLLRRLGRKSPARLQPLLWRLGRKSPARHHVGVTNEGVTPSPSDCRPVHRVALPVLSVSKPVVGAPHASPKCALAVTRLGGTLFLQVLSCVCVVAGCHSCGTTFVVALLFAPRGFEARGLSSLLLG